MIVAPFEPWHLSRLEVQPAQREEAQIQGDFHGSAWSILVGESVICSAGLMELWPGRAYAWALLSVHAGPHMLGLTRIGRSIMDASPYRRIEMYVESEFTAGHRFARLLGFVCETPEGMRGYLPTGAKAHLYAKVR